jgi:hypothetical protein
MQSQSDKGWNRVMKTISQFHKISSAAFSQSRDKSFVTFHPENGPEIKFTANNLLRTEVSKGDRLPAFFCLNPLGILDIKE